MFEIREDFYLDNKKFKLISGAIHYFRVVPEYWQDRLEKLKNMGCNTVETIVPWNIHETFENKYNYSGICDIRKYIEIAHQLGLYVIIRPSPYICGEWEFGGTPYWLLNKLDMRLRSSEGPYLEYVAKHYNRLFKEFKGMYINDGGPIIMMQVENEYGYFANDKQYLRNLKQLMIDNGCIVPLFTSDGPWGDAISSGNLMDEGVLETLNCGSDTQNHFKAFAKIYPHTPLVCMEYWIGWFDGYGENHHARSAINCADELDNILEVGHVNIYVFHGGTNFGFMNGSNDYDRYLALVSSYDYDALLREDGSYTEKYNMFKKIIAKHVKIEEVPLTTNIEAKAYNTIECVGRKSLFNIIDDISNVIEAQYPKSFEKLDYPYGYVVYESNLGVSRNIDSLKIYKGKDRASIYLNNNYIATQFDREIGDTIKIGEIKQDDKIKILVENMGRINFHEKMDHEFKGIAHSVLVNKVIHTSWKHYCLDFEKAGSLDFNEIENTNNPTFSIYNLIIDICCDTYLDVSKFGKGVVIINNFVLGKFWDIGPQERLYIPAPLLKVGLNKIVIFETEGKVCDEVTFHKEAKWSRIENYNAVENN